MRAYEVCKEVYYSRCCLPSTLKTLSDMPTSRRNNINGWMFFHAIQRRPKTLWRMTTEETKDTMKWWTDWTKVSEEYYLMRKTNRVHFKGERSAVLIHRSLLMHNDKQHRYTAKWIGGNIIEFSSTSLLFFTSCIILKNYARTRSWNSGEGICNTNWNIGANCRWAMEHLVLVTNFACIQIYKRAEFVNFEPIRNKNSCYISSFTCHNVRLQKKELPVIFATDATTEQV